MKRKIEQIDEEEPTPTEVVQRKISSRKIDPKSDFDQVVVEKSLEI